MRLFDTDKVGCYLDTFTPRVETTKDGKELKLLDLTLRVQPFTQELAMAVHPEIRKALFRLTDMEPHPMIKAVAFKMPCDKQRIEVYLLPESDVAQVAFFDVEIDAPRARTEKGVDGYAFIFYATVGPIGRDETELIRDWHTQCRFLTFAPQQPSLLDAPGVATEAAAGVM